MNSKDTTQHSDDKIIRQTDEETPQDEKETGRQTDKSIRHIGGCHCGTVRYEFYAPKVLRCFRCNCSICTKKQHILHAPVNQFKLLQGEDSLTTYTFNTHQAKHMFCKICGIHSFYMPRAYPGHYGVMPYCLDSGTVDKIIIQEFDGINY